MPGIAASKLRLRFAVLLSAALAALLLPGAGGNGQASPSPLVDLPELDLVPGSTVLGRTAATWADLYMPSTTEMAKVVLFLPAYGGVLGRAPNATVGDAVAFGPNLQFALASITVADPAQYASNTCAPGLHEAVWLLTPDDQGDFPVTPILIDATSGSDTALGAYKAQFCLPPSASGSIKFRELDLEVTKLTNPAATGAYKWRAFVTPYRNGAPNDAGTFEVRGTIPMPTVLTLHARYDRKHKRAILTGRFSAASYDATGTYLDLDTVKEGSLSYAATARVTARGTYSLKRRIKKTTRFRMVTATYDDCDPGSPAPAGCLSDALADVYSPVVKVVVRKR